jgi:hypothetical protein
MSRWPWSHSVASSTQALNEKHPGTPGTPTPASPAPWEDATFLSEAGPAGHGAFRGEGEGEGGRTRRRSRKTWIWAAAALVGAIVIALAVALPIELTRKHSGASGSGGGGGSSGAGAGVGSKATVHFLRVATRPPRLTEGADGWRWLGRDGGERYDVHVQQHLRRLLCVSPSFPASLLHLIHIRAPAGVDDPSDPFNNNAQPNSWTPPLNTTWDWATDRIAGVSLGGLFVLEPFITPGIFQRYPNATDEWSLSEDMRLDTANGGIGQLEEHYATFIVRAPCYSVL